MSKPKLGLRRAGTAGIAVALTLGVAGLTAESASADLAPAGGQIGINDTAATTPGTQGATLVTPGADGQALDDVQLLLPNSFKNGDTIDLAIYDRTATASSNGQINADAAHKLGFSGTPTVTVPATPYVATTNIGPTEPTDGDTQNNPVADTSATKATTAPVFTTSLVQSSRAHGLATDIVRLTVNGVQAAGDPGDKWIVNVAGLKADLGSAVSPGELRVVPFSYNGTPSSTNTNATPTFGNVPTAPGVTQVINTYTVPAYVAPVNFNVGAPNNIVADGTAQNVGPITIAETNNYSLQNGTYTVHVGGPATVANNTTGTPVTVTANGGGTGETVTSPATVSGNDVSFQLSGASDATKLTVVLNGLQLLSDSKGAITYTLTGGSIQQPPTDTTAPAFLQDAGKSDAIGGTLLAPDVPADSAFSTGTGVNQTDIQAPPLTVDSAAVSLPARIGGADRYETAAHIALFNGYNDNVVLASGQNFPDALSSDYLSSQEGGASIMLTRTASLPSVTRDALRTLGARTVYVVGGTSAVSDAVVNELKSLSQYYPGGNETIGQGKLQVVRISGANRYATNQQVNEYAFNADGGTSVGRTDITFGSASKATALLATGSDYADALSAGPAVSGPGNGSLPLILTNGTTLSASAVDQLNSFGIKQVVIAGGENAVSSGVESQLTSMGIAVKRVKGTNRYGTAAAMADFERADFTPTSTTDGGLGFVGDTAGLATGQKFADALAAGPYLGNRRDSLVLSTTSSLSPETSTWLKANAADLSGITAFGLGGAISDATLAAANAAISGN